MPLNSLVRDTEQRARSIINLCRSAHLITNIGNDEQELQAHVQALHEIILTIDCRACNIERSLRNFLKRR